jgi:hypothetical protein
MNRDDKDQIATLRENLRRLLDSRRDYFVIDALTFSTGGVFQAETLGTEPGDASGRVVSAASLRLVIDWCDNDFPMSLEEFLSGMFYGREWDGETRIHKLIPESKDRLTADSLGFGHLYPPKEGV